MTKAKTYREESERWVKPIPSSSYLPIVPFSSVLESPILFNKKGEQIDEIMELIETSQKSQMNNTIDEATSTILFQDSLNSC